MMWKTGPDDRFVKLDSGAWIRASAVAAVDVERTEHSISVSNVVQVILHSGVRLHAGQVSTSLASTVSSEDEADIVDTYVKNLIESLFGPIVPQEEPHDDPDR